jgi:N-acetylneuraminic acid mutarotase
MQNRRFGRVLIFAGAMAVFVAASSAVHAQGKWHAGAPIPEGANEVIGVAIDAQMLVYGGQDPTSSPQGIFWKYDPAANNWIKLPSNPVPVHHGAAVAIGRKMYVLGGFRLPGTGKPGWYPEDKAWVFDFDTQKWSALPPMPTARGALAAVAVDKKIYVSGGAGIPRGMQVPDGLLPGGPMELYGTLEMFDTETNKWTTLAAMPTPRNHHSIAAVGGKLYAIGGRVGSCYSGGWSSNVWMNEEYDIASNTWATRAAMPTARSGIGIAVTDGLVHVLGGEGWVDDFGGVFRAHEVYDPKTNTWSRAQRMLTPRHGFATAVIGNTIYAVSGVNNAGGAGTLSVVSVNEIYEP